MTKTDKTKLMDDEERGRTSGEGCCVAGTYDTWVRPVLAEFIGVIVFVFIGVLSIGTGEILQLALVHGLTFTFMAISFAPVSGAHLNPAVTFAVLICGYIRPLKALLYVIFQLAGAAIGAGIAKGVMDDLTYSMISGGAPVVAGTTKLAQALGLEFLIMFMAVLVFLVGQVDNECSAAPAARGLVYVAAMISTYAITGGVVNVVQVFGPLAVFSVESSDLWLEAWIYFVASGLAAAVAAVVFKAFLASSDRRWKCVTASEVQ